MEELAKFQLETEMTCPALACLRGASVHGHSLRLQEDGVMFDMLERVRLENGTIIVQKDLVGRPIDKKVDLGKPMSDEEAAKRTTIYRVDNVPYREDKEVLEWVHRVFEQRTMYGYKPAVQE
jgi:methyl-coenzyme M reductase gamma subunit